MNHAHEKVWIATPILLRFGAPENGISTLRVGFTPVTMTQKYVTSIFLDDSQTPPNPGFLLYELLVLDTFPHTYRRGLPCPQRIVYI